MSPEEFQRMIAPLRDEYRAALPATLASVAQLWQSVLEGKETAMDRDTLRREVHNLAGTGSTFGLPGLTEAARAFEMLWDAADLSHQPLYAEPQQRQQLQQAMDALFRAAQA
jgi:HPt (histidine-containing phosphotransfer) domain-containing protein